MWKIFFNRNVVLNCKHCIKHPRRQTASKNILNALLAPYKKRYRVKYLNQECKPCCRGDWYLVKSYFFKNLIARKLKKINTVNCYVSNFKKSNAQIFRILKTQKASRERLATTWQPPVLSSCRGLLPVAWCNRFQRGLLLPPYLR